LTNRIQDAFDNIEASEGLKSSTMQFLQTEREKRNPRQFRRPVWGKAIAAACAMLVLMVGIGGYYYYTMRTPVSFVSIDVNPSVELALNRCDRVVSATAYNEDGEIVLDGVTVKGKLYTEAIDLIVESDAIQPYLAEDSDLTFTVASGDSNKENAILTGIENCSGCQKHGGQSYTADVNSMTEAHDSGLSFGKYAAYLVLSQYDSTVTAEDCQNMSMAEIHSQINEHENDVEHNENSGEGASGHNGNGCSDTSFENGNGHGH